MLLPVRIRKLRECNLVFACIAGTAIWNCDIRRDMPKVLPGVSWFAIT